MLAAITLVALSTPHQAAASAPDAWTDYDSRLAPDAVTVYGEANTGGEPTTFHFEYAPTASDFCTSNATTGAPLATTDDRPVHYDSETLETEITGLTPGAEFCFRIVAHNASGVAPGQLHKFTVGAPAVDTARQRNTAPGASTLRGWIGAAGQPADYHFEWGQPPDCIAHRTPQQTLPTSAWDGNVEASLDGLTPGSTYCFRLVASNPSAARNGGVLSFTAGLPQLAPPQATATGPATETLSQMVNPAGQDTTYHVEYDPFGSYFCIFWEHAVPSATHSAAGGIVAGAAGETRVTTTLEGLVPGTEYCSRLIVRNASGATEDDNYDRWTAGAPELKLISVAPVGPRAAIARATLNPAGTATSVSFKYGRAGTQACSYPNRAGVLTTAPQPVPGDTTEHEVVAHIDGLSPGTAYCAWAEVASGQVSASSGFTTPPAEPPGPTGEPPGGTPPPPLLRSFSLPARVTTPHFGAIHATVDLGSAGTTVTLNAYRLLHGVTGARVGGLQRKLVRSGRHQLTVRLTAKSRRQLTKLTSVRLRAKLVVQAPDGRQVKRTADIQLRRRR